MAEDGKVKPVQCTVRPQVHVAVGGDKNQADFHSGCSVIDVLFPNVFFVEIGEIHFKNYYTASITVQATLKEKTASGTGEGKLKTCVKNLLLMPNPHSDQASENYFTITCKQMKFALTNVNKLRFILRQPSPVWKEYKICEITLFKSSINPVEKSLPKWISENHDTDSKKKEIKGLGSMDDLSNKMQQLWAMVAKCKSSQTDTNLGRYDVDGNYEINLLSYT